LQGATFDGKYDWQQYGIDGYSSTLANSYTGSYTVEVDTWNEYPNATFYACPSILLALSGGALSPSDLISFCGVPSATKWYPPVEGLLEGDSFHTIRGSLAGPFGYTGDTLAANGLGPYAQRQVWTLPNAHLGAEGSAIYELDKRGYIGGNIYGFTYDNQLRTVSWATVEASAATGNMSFTRYSWDAHYDMYLDPGQYSMTIAAWTPSGNQGYNTISSSVNISSGQSTTGVDFQLERSNVPIPEFTGIAIVAFSALGASLYLLRRRTR
jgi:hypothetical protein